MLVPGKGLGEDVRNGAAARPGVASREGRTGEEQEEKVREKGKGLRATPTECSFGPLPHR